MLCHSQDPGPVNTLFAPARFVHENVFVTKREQYAVVFRLDGIDSECLADGTLETCSQRLAAAFRTLDEDFRIYQYVVKQDHAAIETSDSHPNPVVERTLKARNDFLRSKADALYSLRLYWVILYEPMIIKPKLRTKKALQMQNAALKRNIETLLTRAHLFRVAIDDLVGLQLLGKRDAFDFLRLLANLTPDIAEAESVSYDNHLDYWMGGSHIACSPNGIRIGREYVEVLTLRKPPKNTFPNVLRDFLAIPANFVLCSEYKREPNDTAIAAISAAQTHFFWSQWVRNIWAVGQLATNRGKRDDIVADASAKADVDELGKTLERMNNDGETMGRYSFTLLMHGPTRAALQPAIAEAAKILGNHEGSLVRETYNALRSLQAVIPGGQDWNKRYLWMLSANYADLAFAYAPGSGHKQNAHLGQEHLLVLETNERTPFYFNLHEADTPNSLIFGVTGGGKTFLCNALIDHAQKYSPLTFILDIGHSYRQLARKHGGSYVHMQFADGGFHINPFHLPKTKDNLQFLFSFLRILVTNSGHVPTPQDDRAIYEAVKTASRLGDLALPEHLRVCLHAWIGEDGQYGAIFDNVEDSLRLAHFQVFDFQGLELYPQVLEPLLFYIFHRISALVYDPQTRETPKHLWADEVWRFLTNDTAKQYLLAAGKTWRKHNGGIGLITQSAGDLEMAGMLALANEMCPTKLLLANPGADLGFYRQQFHLNERETELFASLIPKRQFLLKTPTLAKVLNLNADPLARWTYANSPGENAARERAIAEHGFEKGLEVLSGGRMTVLNLQHLLAERDR